MARTCWCGPFVIETESNYGLFTAAFFAGAFLAGAFFTGAF